jgi:hypothetical protein
MADTTPVEPDTLAEDDSGASGRDASKAERKTRSAPATKPRRRTPAKPSESRAKSSAKSGDKPSSDRFERADGQARKTPGPAAATDPTAATAVVDASILLDRVAELTSVAERQRVRLDEDEAERNRLQSELKNERQRRETAERRLVDLEGRYNELAAELASEREAR